MSIGRPNKKRRQRESWGGEPFETIKLSIKLYEMIDVSRTWLFHLWVKPPLRPQVNSRAARRADMIVADVKRGVGGEQESDVSQVL